MPYTAKNAYRHTHKATTARKRKAWSKVANKILRSKKYGARKEEAAVRIANYVVNRMTRGKNHASTRSKSKIHARKSNRNSGFRHSQTTKRKISRALLRFHRSKRKSRR